MLLGIGDDAALLSPPPERMLTAAIATGTAAAGGPGPSPSPDPGLGPGVLAKALNRLAATGAEPAWATLALTAPQAGPEWLESFSRGLFELAAAHGVALVGGDTTQGPFVVTIACIGTVRKEQAITPRGARAGDVVFVTGTLGETALASAVAAGEVEPPEGVSVRPGPPAPRVAEGRALGGLATGAVDLADGLESALPALLDASGVGATIDVTRLPLPDAVAALPRGRRREMALGGRGDLELCFTAPGARRGRIEARLHAIGTRCTAIGHIESTPGLSLEGEAGAGG